jgi:hypothetical protein
MLFIKISSQVARIFAIRPDVGGRREFRMARCIFLAKDRETKTIVFAISAAVKAAAETIGRSHPRSSLRA